MSAETLARWQFGITTVYHFFFVPLTIGLSLLVAIFQTLWVRSRDEKFLRLTKFYGKLMLINFAMGVVTGIVQEFQFGMNWSEYSRFVGDIFGAPLALEALLAFFAESTFLGLWIFGWDRLSKRVHLTMIWLVALATMVSATFILAANSFMQNPVGATFNAQSGRAELHNLGDVFVNPVFLATFPHTIASSWMVATAFVAAIAGWHLARMHRADAVTTEHVVPAESTVATHATERVVPADTHDRAVVLDEGHETATKPARAAVDSGAIAAGDHVDHAAADRDTWRWALKFGAIGLILSGLLVCLTGHFQGLIMTKVQPMKMAAAEALYDGQSDASFSLFTVGSLNADKEIFSVRVPNVLSFMATGDVHGHVEGINDVNQRYTKEFTDPGQITEGTTLSKQVKDAGVEQRFNQGRTKFSPNIPVTFWTFRLMMGFGFLAMLIGAIMLFEMRGKRTPKGGGWWNLMMWAAPLLPLFGISFGWIFTEMGRQPWIVFGVLPTAAAVSPTVTAGEVLFSMIVFTLIYGAFAVVELGLMNKYVREGLPEHVRDEETPDIEDAADKPMSFAY